MNEVINRSLVEWNEQNFAAAFANKDVEFVINDIELPIAPLHISVQKEDLNYSYKTLRTKKSVKIGSGAGVYNLQLSLLFPKETLLMLHRLIVQVRNNPFVFIKNSYIKSLIDPKLYEGKNLFFTVTNLHVKTYDQYPDAYVANMDLRFFNHIPYSNFLKYKKEFLAKVGNTSYSIGVWDSDKPIVEVSKDNRERGPSSRRTNEREGLLTDAIRFGEKESRYEETFGVANPKESNIYVRYYNQLQLNSLEESFGILKSDIKTRLGVKADWFEKGHERFVLGVHSKFLDRKTKKFILDSMTGELNSSVRIYYNEYLQVRLSIDALNQLKELRDDFNSNSSNRNTSRTFNQQIAINLDAYSKANRITLKVEPRLADISEVNVGRITVRDESFSNKYISPIQTNPSISKTTLQAFRETKKLLISFDKVQWIFAPFGGEGVRLEKQGNDLILGNFEKRFTFKNATEIPGMQFPLEGINQGNIIGYASESPLEIEIQDSNFSINELLENRDTAAPNLEFLNPENEKLYSELSLFTDKILNQNYNLYIQENVSNVFYRALSFEIPIGETTDVNEKDSFLINFSGGFQNLVSSIPISGLEYPTHQFLGSIEPNYMFNFVSKENRDGEHGFSFNLEKVRSTLAQNSRMFKQIYDSGNFIVESFITKLLGSFKVGSYRTIQEFKEGTNSTEPFRQYNDLDKKNFIISSVSDESIEGLPGSTSTLLRVSETGSINDEELELVTPTRNEEENSRETNNAAYQNALDLYDRLQERQNLELPNRQFIQGRSNYEPRNWRTQRFSADRWYAKARRKGGRAFNRDMVSDLQDKAAFLFCSGILDKLKIYYGNKNVYVFSTYGDRSATVSHHEVNAAVDLRVEGVHVAEVAAVVELLLEEGVALNLVYQSDPSQPSRDNRKYIGIGVYGNSGSTADGLALENTMNGSRAGGFVHLDLNINTTSLDNDANRDLTSIRREAVRPRRWLGESGGDRFLLRSFWSNQFWEYKRAHKAEILSKIREIFGTQTNNFEVVNEEPEPDNLNINETHDRIGLPELLLVQPNESEIVLEDILYEYKRENKTNAPYTDFLVEEIEYNALSEEDKGRIRNGEDSSFFIIRAVQDRPLRALRRYDTSPVLERTEVLRRITQNNFIIIGSSRIAEYNLRTREIEYRGPEEGTERVLVQRRNRRASNNAAASEYQNLLLKEEQNLKIIIEMIGNFSKFANFILTEPSVYIEDEPEQQAELRRISDELLGTDIDPGLYRYIYKLSSVMKHYTTGRRRSHISVRGEPFNYLNVHEELHFSLFEPFLKIVLNIDYPNPELESFKYFEENDFNYRQWLSTYFKQTGTPIEGGIGELIQKFFIAHPHLQSMNEFANSLQAFNDIKQIINVNYLDNENSSLNIFSEQMDFEGEINRILSFLFNRDNRNNAFVSTRYLENHIKFEGELHEGSSNTLFNLFVEQRRRPDVAFNDYKERSYPQVREQIKLSQDVKLAYLKNLLLSLISKLKTNRVFREALNLNTETDLYRIDISNRNAYPDLDLPADPADPTKNIAMHPGFFFYTQKDKRNVASISELENKAGYEKTLKNSIEFQNFLQSGVFSGSQEALERRRQGIQISGNTVVLDDILLDSSEGSEETRVVSSESNNETNSIQLSNDGLPNTQNGKFGENNFNNIDLSVFKNTTFSSDLYNISESDLKNYLSRINNVSSVLSSYQERIFGSKYGYLKDQIQSDPNISNNIATQISERLGANNPEYVNNNFVKQIVEDSGKAYLAKTESIQKAYPTFKLYLIEEDTQDSDNYYVFDDFYSYSAVKDFTIYKSRKLAADTAVIRLQNISGSLDGTKRVGKRDIDIEREEERVGFIDSGQTISSIVLRPGVNAQLRMGYESDPNKLEIMLSGQITDISWSSQGDMCEVTLQSFGVELESFKFGSESIVEERPDFESTHTLLGYLLLRDELKHFGRHKEGRNVQIFENTETLADKTIYTPDAWKYNWTMNYVSTLNNNSLWLTVALGVGTFLIPGGWILKGGRIVLNAFKITRGRALLGATARGVGARLQGSGRGLTGRILFGKNAIQFQQTSAFKGVAALSSAISSRGFAGGIEAIRNAGVLNTLRASGSLIIRPLEYGVGPIIQIAAVTTGALLIAETAANGASSIYESISKYLREVFTPKKKYLKLSPQDDNIFAPHPNRYINRSENSIDWKSAATKSFLTYLNLRTAGLAARPLDDENPGIELIKNPLQYFDKRFKNGNHKYSLNGLVGGKTVWEIFDEMSIRHPGWVYGARQYGDGLEYRMFFGLPSQKYWARDLSSFVIDRLNRIYLYVSESSDQFTYKDLMSDEQIKRLQGIIGEDADIEEASKKILFAEWMKRTKSRMKPFRSFHHISSSKNLISNQIRGKNENTINTVSVIFNDSNGRKIRTVKAHENIPKEKIRGRQVSYENCKGMEGALRYGIGLLMQSAKEMYTGEILIIGDPSINPHDICILDDHYLDMYGPVEVEAVTHIFGHETGFVTEIKPNAVVTANESVTYTALNAMVWYDVIREMNEEKDSNTIKELEKNQRLSLITDALDNVFSDNETLDNLDSATQEELKRYFKDQIQKAFEEENITLIEDVFNQSGGTPELVRQLETGIDRLLGAGGVGTSAVASGLAARGNPRGAIIAGVLGAIQLGLASLPKSNYFLNQIKNPSSYIHKKLFGGDMHAARVSGTQLLQIYPLYKRGLPILASGFENINPKHVWRNRLGEIFNDVSDAYSGFLNQTEDYKRLGASDLYDGTFDNMLLKVKPFVLSHTGALFGLDRNAIRGYLIDEANNE